MTPEEQREHAKVCEERAAMSNLIADLDGTVNSPYITDSDKVLITQQKLRLFQLQNPTLGVSDEEIGNGTEETHTLAPQHTKDQHGRP